MKRLFIFLSFISVISLASCKMLNSNQAFYFDNKTDKTVTVKGEGANITVNPHEKVRFEAAPTADFSMDNYYRCNLTFTTFGRYEITDKTPHHITVHNNHPSRIIVLQETGKNIGSYAELQSIAASSSTAIGDVSIKIEIAAGGTSTFDVYTAPGNYSTYYKDNNMVLDSRDYLSFN